MSRNSPYSPLDADYDYDTNRTTSTAASTDQDLTSDMTLVSNAMNTRTTTIWNGATHVDGKLPVLTGVAEYTTDLACRFADTDGV